MEYPWNRKEERKRDLTGDSRKKRTEESDFNGTREDGARAHVCMCGLKTDRRHKISEMMKCFLRGLQPFMFSTCHRTGQVICALFDCF